MFKGQNHSDSRQKPSIDNQKSQVGGKFTYNRYILAVSKLYRQFFLPANLMELHNVERYEAEP